MCFIAGIMGFVAVCLIYSLILYKPDNKDEKSAYTEPLLHKERTYSNISPRKSTNKRIVSNNAY